MEEHYLSRSQGYLHRVCQREAGKLTTLDKFLNIKKKYNRPRGF